MLQKTKRAICEPVVSVNKLTLLATDDRLRTGYSCLLECLVLCVFGFSLTRQTLI